MLPRTVQYGGATRGGWVEATAEPWMRSHDRVAPPFYGLMDAALELSVVHNHDEDHSMNRQATTEDKMLHPLDMGYEHPLHSNFAAHAIKDFGRIHAYASNKHYNINLHNLYQRVGTRRKNAIRMSDPVSRSCPQCPAKIALP